MISIKKCHFFISLNMSKLVKPLVYIIVLVYLFINIISYNFWGLEMREYHYFSPNKTHILVIDEMAFLLGANINVYELKCGIFKKRFPDIYINTDDGYTPFQNLINVVDISYFSNFDGRKEWDKQRVKFKL